MAAINNVDQLQQLIFIVPVKIQYMNFQVAGLLLFFIVLQNYIQLSLQSFFRS